MNYRLFLPRVLPLVLVACTGGEPGGQPVPETEKPAAAVPRQPSVERWFTAEQAGKGAEVYGANCAACHGKEAEGAPDWRRAGPDGKYPAPPLNGTGHAWHHPLRILAHVIKNGSPGGQGNMPAWKEKLSNDEILAVIAWFQSHWPEELYNAWARRNADKRGKA